MTHKNRVAAAAPCEEAGKILSPQPKTMGLKKRFMSLLGFADEHQQCPELDEFDEARLQAEARENFNTSWSVLNCNTGWKKEKETSTGDLVESKGVAKQRKIFRLKGRIEIPPKMLLEELYYKAEDMPAWNPTIVQSRRLQVLDEHTDILYQISAESGGGVVTSREFVILRHWSVKDGTYVSSGCSCTHLSAPENKKLIRAINGPNCWAMQPVPDRPNECNFLWLLDTDLRGWVPQYMVEAALSSAMLDFLSSLRQFAAKLKEEGKFPTNA